MAYRSSASTPQASGTSLVANVPAGVLNGDYMLAVIAQDGAPPDTITPPAGWTLVDSGDQTTPDGCSNRLYERYSGGSEPSTYTWTLSGSTVSEAVIVALSGRKTSSARTFFAQTQQTTSTASPITTASTGGVAVAGDDLVFFISMDFPAGPNDFSLGAGSSGFLVKENTNSPAWIAVHSMVKANVGAGATGNIAGVETFTAAGAGFTSWVVSVAQAPAATGGPPTNKLAMGLGIFL